MVVATPTQDYLLEMGWSNGVLELAGPGSGLLFLSPSDLDRTGGRFVARRPTNPGVGFRHPFTHRVTAIHIQSNKGLFASVSLPGAQLSVDPDFGFAFRWVDCLPNSQLVL